MATATATASGDDGDGDGRCTGVMNSAALENRKRKCCQTGPNKQISGTELNGMTEENIITVSCNRAALRPIYNDAAQVHILSTKKRTIMGVTATPQLGCLGACILP